MKTLRTLGIALFAVFALGALAAANASAAELEWLVNGAVLTEALNSEIEGEIELVFYNGDEKLSEILTKVLCSVIFDTKIGPGDKMEFISALTLGKGLTGKDQLLENGENTLEGTPLLCNVTEDSGSLEDCKEGENAAEVWFANMPWDYELILLNLPGSFGGSPRKTPEAEKTPGWEIECTALIGIKGSNLCEGGPETLVENNIETSPASVLETFHELEDEDLAACSLTGEHSSDLVSEDEGTESSDQWAVGAELERLTTAVSNES